MKSLIRMSFMVGTIAAFVIPAVTAHAWNTEHFYSAEEAVEEGEGNAPSTSIPFYFEGQAHLPAVRVTAKHQVPWMTLHQILGIWVVREEQCRARAIQF